MTELLIWVIILTIPTSIIAYVLVTLVYATYMDTKYPSKPIHYSWRTIWPDYKGDWERGKATEVYIDITNNDIRGKVVCQTDGLYLATMWNGTTKEFLMDFEAVKWVEQYKPRVYK